MLLKRFTILILCLGEGIAIAQDLDDPFQRPAGFSPGRIAAEEEEETPGAEELLQRLDAARRSAAAVRESLGQPAPAAAKDAGPLRLIPADLHLGKDYARGVRYLALRVRLVNVTDEPVTVLRESFRLATRGVELAPGQVPERPGLRTLPGGRRAIGIEELSKTGPLTVPARGVIETPIGFFGLPGNADVPEMTLRLPLGREVAELDLNDDALGLMRLKVERLGPGGLLALVTIGGEITAVGVGELTETIQELTNAKATRVVLAWEKEAPAVLPDIANWLVQSATRLGGAPANDGQRPVLAPGAAELHLAALPDGTGVPNYPGPRRVHQTSQEAVAAALGDAFELVPLAALLEEIESGHPLTRPAAIAAGDRLPDDALLIKLTKDGDPAIATAAVRALRGHGSPAAIGRLVELAKRGAEPMRSAAAGSLAGSRYGAAHEALRELLDASANGGAQIPPAALVPVLAENPRPLWGDALHRLATQGDPAVRGEALEALSKLGHPKLTDAFEKALSDPDERLRVRTFGVLSNRQDRESEELAIEFTLRHLEERPPTREMILLLNRTKDQRAVPLLVRHLETGGSQRAELVKLLAQIGGLEVREALEEVYPKLERAAQPHALARLAQLESPRFYEFARVALTSNDPALVNAAAQQLQMDGGPEAVALLSDILLGEKQASVLAYVANALGGIGTREARIALRTAARTDDERGRAAGQAWWNLQRQSAGWDFFIAAEGARKREDWKEAAARYTEVIEVDPEFVDAWSGRANAFMQMEEHPSARADYEQVLELDPKDAAAVTCLGILRVFDGRVEEALAFVRERSAEFEASPLFAYNTACLYSVAADRIAREEAARAESLREDAVKELARSIELGMTDAEDVTWMRKDPDLKSLHGREDFEKVVTEAEGNVGKK